MVLKGKPFRAIQLRGQIGLQRLFPQNILIIGISLLNDSQRKSLGVREEVRGGGVSRKEEKIEDLVGRIQRDDRKVSQNDQKEVIIPG